MKKIALTLAILAAGAGGCGTAAPCAEDKPYACEQELHKDAAGRAAREAQEEHTDATKRVQEEMAAR